MRYRTLDAKLIIETAERLEKRVAERFPDAGLRGVAIELVSLSRDLAKAAKALEAPIWWLRGVVITAIAAGALTFLFVGTSCRSAASRAPTMPSSRCKASNP
jgi:hypothetical protein